MFTGSGLMYANVDISLVLQKKCVPELGRQGDAFLRLGGDWFGPGYWFDPCEFGQIPRIEHALPAVVAIDEGLNPGALHAIVENPGRQSGEITHLAITDQIARIHR